MQAFLAIIGDTWRQSKQQWVFIILLGMLAIVTGLFAFGTKVHDYADDAKEENRYTLIWRWDDAPDQFTREDNWKGIYASVIAKQQGRDEILYVKRREIMELDEKIKVLNEENSAAHARKATEAELKEINSRAKPVMDEHKEKTVALDKLNFDMMKEARQEVDRRSGDISDLQKALEITLMEVARYLTWLSLLGFIAAAAGYFPGLIAQGSVDSVLARPVSRAQVFFGKYVGGLVLISAALLACWLVLFVSFGLVTGIWHFRFFGALPMTILAVSLIYAIVAWVGLITRSMALALVTGYFFYLVIDTAVLMMVTIVPMDPLFSKWKWVVTLAEFVKLTFPNFGLMRTSAEASICNVPIFEWQPTIVAFTWLTLLLVTAFLRFRRTDF